MVRATVFILAFISAIGLVISIVYVLFAPPANATPISWDIPGGGGASPIIRVYTSGTGATETIPTGVSQVVIEGCGAGGGGGTNNGVGGAGGGSGGYVKKTLALTSANWGQTFIYTVAQGAAGGSGFGNNPGTDAGSTTVVNGTFPTSTGLTGGGGGGGLANGGAPGSGGTASGGDTNTNGNTGIPFAGGVSPGIAGVNCTSGSGGGGNINPADGGTGGGGSVAFAYT